MAHKEMKGLLNLGKCQCIDFAGQIAGLSLCMIQYNILGCVKRFEAYETIGGLFAEVTGETVELSVAQRIWGLIVEVITQMINQTKKETAVGSGDTYLVWGCLAAVFAVYMIICFAFWNKLDCWKGMFLLGLLLPGLGSACTGVILKEKVITVCGGLGASLGLLFLPQLCKGGNFPLTWTILMAIAMIISLVVPGHILNHKAKKANA